MNSAKRAIGTLLLLLGVAAHGQPTSPPTTERPLSTRERMERLSARMQEEAEAVKVRDAAVNEHLKTLPNHEWAGTYSTGFGLGGLTLCVAPDTGFTYHEWSDIGDQDMNFGTVKEVKPDRLILTCVIDPKLNNADFFSDQMLRVKWGERRYLVSDHGVVGFCNAFNLGALERPQTPFVMLRKGDEHAKGEGMPTVPEEYRKYLLAKPITAALSAVDPPRRDPMPQGMKMERVQIHATLPVGSRQGVQPGMEFAVINPQQYQKATVLEARENKCTVEFTDYVTAGLPGIAPQVGWRLSTRDWIGDMPGANPDQRK